MKSSDEELSIDLLESKRRVPIMEGNARIWAHSTSNATYHQQKHPPRVLFLLPPPLTIPTIPKPQKRRSTGSSFRPAKSHEDISPHFHAPLPAISLLRHSSSPHNPLDHHHHPRAHLRDGSEPNCHFDKSSTPIQLLLILYAFVPDYFSGSVSGGVFDHECFWLVGTSAFTAV